MKKFLYVTLLLTLALGAFVGFRTLSLAVAGGNGSHRSVPILIYHEVQSPPLHAGDSRYLYVEPADFARQLDWLQKKGYQTVSLREVYNHWHYGAPLPDKPVVLTFDDGYRSMYTVAFSLLRERNMRGTFFLIPGTLDQENYLTEQMVAEMAAYGMEIGSHSYNHLDLTLIAPDQFPLELGDSKSALERITNHSVEFFCYPYGFYNEEVIRGLKDYAYVAAVTTEHGRAGSHQDAYRWSRINIVYRDGVAGMVWKILASR